MTTWLWDGPTKGQRVGGRFLLEELIGRGAQSVVWLATDLTETRVSGVPQRVALKILCPRGDSERGAASSVRPGDLLRMRHEAGALAELGHPAIVRLIHAGIEGGAVYLALEHVAGRSLDRVITRAECPPPRRVAAWGAELCDALALVHDRGILHRDIKPANILVDGPRVKLLDFGMARVRGMHADLDRGVILGTLPYLALEAWGLGGDKIDGRVDLYALAATLYEVVTGKRAFDGSTPAEILDNHRQGEPADPCRLNPAVPRALSDVLLRALQREPSGRYRCASGMAADLRRIAGGNPSPFPLGRDDHATRLAVPASVGREPERQALLDHVERAARGLGGVVLVESEPGGGRTRFVEETAEAVRARGGLVLFGRCHGQRHDVPYDAAMQAFAHFRAQLTLLSDADRTARLQSLRRSLDGRADPLLAMAPSLRGPLLAGPPEGDGCSDRRQFVRTLRDALLGTATEGRPTVVVIDDAHRADSSTRGLLLDLASALADRPVLLVLTAATTSVRGTNVESMDGSARDFLAQVVATAHPNLARLLLPPLDADEVTGLLRSMLGSRDPELAQLGEWVHRAAGGNPAQAVQLVRSLEEGGALKSAPVGWRVDMRAAAAAELPHDLVRAMVRRLDGLGADVSRYLAAAALLGATFRTDQLVRVLVELGEPPAPVLHALDRAYDAGLVATSEDADGRPGWRFPHEPARREIGRRWSLANRPALHAAAARVLTDGRRPADLDDACLFAVAHHALRAPSPTYGLDIALQAADRALVRCAWQAADRLFASVSRAARCATERRSADLGRARALLLGSRNGRAERLLDGVLERATDVLDRAETLTLRAAARSERGHVEEAEADMADAAHLLEVAWPGDDRGARRARSWEATRHPGRLLGLQVAREGREPTRREALQLQLLEQAGRFEALRRPSIAALLATRELRTALELGARRRAALAAGRLACVLCFAGGRGWNVDRLLLSAERLLGPGAHPLARAELLGWRGATELFGGSAAGARRLLDEATSELRRLGERRLRRRFEALGGLASLLTGDLEGFKSRMERLHPGRRRGRPGAVFASVGLSLDALHHGKPGRALDWVEAALREASDGATELSAWAVGVRARVQAAAGETGAALEDARRLESAAPGEVATWFRLAGRLEAARACAEVGRPREAMSVLPSEREVRDRGALSALREAVLARVELAKGGGDKALRRAARTLDREGLGFEASGAWATVHDTTDDDAARSSGVRSLSTCRGAEQTTAGLRLTGAAAHSELERGAERLSLALARRYPTDEVGRRTIRARSATDPFASTWLSDAARSGPGGRRTG